MSTRTMDVLMAPRIIRIATGYALRATSNSSPVPTHKSCPYRQQHLSLIQWLETAHRPTRDAVFPDRSRPFIDQLHHSRAQAGGAEIRSSFVVGFVPGIVRSTATRRPPTLVPSPARTRINPLASLHGT